MNFETIDYLKKGNDKQQKAYQVLNKYDIFGKLKLFQPLLTGTIPINIDIEHSDLDIICYWQDKALFITTLKEYFAKLDKNFTLTELYVKGYDTIMANFTLEEFEIEIFGQNRPSREQEAFRHLLIEAEILKSKDETFRAEIIKLKKQGFKTEPAFAKLLKLKGEPYLSLLDYKVLDT